MVDEDEAARSNTARRLWVHVLEKGWQVSNSSARALWSHQP
jgi:hypothetical protein